MKTCKSCKEKFEVKYFNQKYCMIKDECIKAFYQENKEKKQSKAEKEARKEKKEAKVNMMTHKDYLKLLQVVFNTFIRLRDKDLPCISCGKTKAEEFHAGHYIATTYQYLRFNENNCHKQCSKCNTHLRGNSIPYRIELINRIGLPEVEKLESERHLPLKITIPEIQGQIKLYKLKIKELKNNTCSLNN